MKFYVGINKDKEYVKQGLDLGAEGIVTNSTVLLNTYGTDMTLYEMALQAHNDYPNTMFYMSIHGEKCEDIVNKALEISKISEKIGFKVVSNLEGMKAIKVLADRGLKCIATGMFTDVQALVAAQVGAFAVSPFIGRGNDVGLDMRKNLLNIRKAFDRIENPPMLFAASIRTEDDVNIAIEAQADAIIVPMGLLKKLLNNEYTLKTELGFAKEFSKFKGEDVSYLSEIDKIEDVTHE